jgi:hypothetical protein
VRVVARLKCSRPELLAPLGGREVMIESPVIQDLLAKTRREAILGVLKDRFGKVPMDVRRLLAEMNVEKRLRRLFVLDDRFINW